MPTELFLFSIVLLIVATRIEEIEISTDDVTKYVASERCDNGVISYNSIAQSESIVSALEDGTSLWVSGFVKYSVPILLEGCFYMSEEPSFFRHTPSSGHLLYSCCEFCRDRDQSWFVTKGDRCYCAYSSPNTRGSSARCDVAPTEMLRPDFKNNQAYYMSFYINRKIFQGIYGQCLLMDHGWSPCAKAIVEPFGIVCRGLKSVTNVHLHMGSWIKALEACFNLSSVVLYLLDTNGKSWSPVFRPFTILQETSLITNDSRPNICLSVTKLNAKLQPEPDDCTAKKRFVCTPLQSSKDIPKDTQSTSPQNSSERTMTSTNDGLTPGPGMFRAEYIYTTTSVSLLCVLLAGTVLAIWIKLKKANKVLNRQDAVSENSIPLENHYDELEDNYLHPEDHEQSPVPHPLNCPGADDDSRGMTYYSEIEDDPHLEPVGISGHLVERDSTRRLTPESLHAEAESWYMYIHPEGNSDQIETIGLPFVFESMDGDANGEETNSEYIHAI